VILLIDNYDSFAHNLARYLRRLGQRVEVLRNDEITAGAVRERKYAAIVISPGPCTPTEAGCSLEVIRLCHAETPILGVCLGHQAIGMAMGARVERAPWPVHGRTSQIEHARMGIFENLPAPLTVCRYHSLIVSRRDLPACLEMTAWTSDGVVMALAHREAPLYGVQFHPEAILTQHGDRLLANFLRLAGLEVPAGTAEFAAEERSGPHEITVAPEAHLLSELVYPIGVVDVGEVDVTGGPP
jgi:anthranilate synthase/aminodeoxychorismate synthase-like glutamine amidotransferase